EAGTNGLHLIARGADRADFEMCLADAKLLANREAIHVQAIGGDVLAEIPRPQVHGFQSLAIHEQDLALAARPPMGAAFKTAIACRVDFGKFLHRQVFLRGTEKILDSWHSPNLLRHSDGLSVPRYLSCSAFPQI